MKKIIFTVLSAFVMSCIISAVPAKAAPIEIGALDFPPYYVVENNTDIKGGLLVDWLKMRFSAC